MKNHIITLIALLVTAAPQLSANDVTETTSLTLIVAKSPDNNLDIVKTGNKIDPPIIEDMTRYDLYEAPVNTDLYYAATDPFSAFSTNEESKSVIIPTGKSNPKDLAKTREDLSIMSRIFNKKMQNNNKVQYTWIGFSKQVIDRFYIEGYGAIFLLQTKYPLAPTQKAKPVEQQNTDIDPVWEQAKNDILGNRKSTFMRNSYEAQNHARQIQQQYSAEKVDNLKNNLIKSLKHASNITALAPEDVIVLNITSTLDTQLNKRVSGNESRNKTIIIRAKKSDIDKYAQNILNDKQFEKVVTVITL